MYLYVFAVDRLFSKYQKSQSTLTDYIEDGRIRHAPSLHSKDLLCGNATKSFPIVIGVSTVSENAASGESSLRFSRQCIIDDESANGFPIERPSDCGERFGVPHSAIDLV